MSKLAFALVFLIYSVSADSCQNNKPSTLKTYTINLDLDPYLRFQQVATDFKDGIVELVNAQK